MQACRATLHEYERRRVERNVLDGATSVASLNDIRHDIYTKYGELAEYAFCLLLADLLNVQIHSAFWIAYAKVRYRVLCYQYGCRELDFETHAQALCDSLYVDVTPDTLLTAYTYTDKLMESLEEARTEGATAPTLAKIASPDWPVVRIQGVIDEEAFAFWFSDLFAAPAGGTRPSPNKA